MGPSANFASITAGAPSPDVVPRDHQDGQGGQLLQDLRELEQLVEGDDESGEVVQL